jgi:hypothetical protein
LKHPLSLDWSLSISAIGSYRYLEGEAGGGRRGERRGKGIGSVRGHIDGEYEIGIWLLVYRIAGDDEPMAKGR